MRLWGATERDFDWQLAAAALLLCLAGVIMVFSATQTEQGNLAGLWAKQLLWVVIGLAAMAVFTAVPFRYFEALAWPFYAGSLALLVLVLFAPAQAKAHRWFTLGAFQFQPSELAKVATVFIVARTLTARAWQRRPMLRVAICCLLALVPMGLVLIEPDLGTSLSFPALLLGMLFWARVPLKTLFFMLSPFLSVLAVVSMPSWVVFMAVLVAAFWLFKTRFRVAVPLFLLNAAIGSLAPMLWNHLREYQQRRILIFINPGLDPKGAGWHVLQSKIAIGSGGFFGKGFLAGTQKKLSFLPAQQTDFIFSTIGEEFGFLGCLAVILLFGWLIYRSLGIAQQARNGFASLTVIGLLSIISFHVVLNIGMTLGLLPVTGIPLPFLSYGGSATIAMMSMVGIVLNIGLRRYEY
jgi:rod shape determining protein RodA